MLRNTGPALCVRPGDCSDTHRHKEVERDVIAISAAMANEQVAQKVPSDAAVNEMIYFTLACVVISSYR